MRRHLLVLITALVLVAGACGGDGNDDAAGSEVGVMVGSSGGEVTSSDGRLSLSIPSGALDDDVEISIDPVRRAEWPEDIAETEPLALYRLEPDGLGFSEPVGIVLNLDAIVSDGAVTVPILASRSSDGEPSLLDTEAQIDLDAETVSVSSLIGHFSWLLVHSGGLTIFLEKIEPPQRAVGSEWSAEIRIKAEDLGGADEVYIAAILLEAEDAVELAGDESLRAGFTIREGWIAGDDPTQEPLEGRWTCLEPGNGFYGATVEFDRQAPRGFDQFQPPQQVRANAFVHVECIPAPATTSTSNVTGSEEPTTDNTTHTETTSVVDVPVVCEVFVFDVAASTPCVQEGVARAGTAAVVLGNDYAWSFSTSDPGTIICESPCVVDPTTLSHVEPGEWPFQQFLVEFHVGDDRAILCDDDPAFPCQLTNMRTFELLSPEAEGVPVPERVIAEEQVGLELSGPWGFDPATGAPEIGGVSIVQIVIQWWYGEEPTNSELSLLTISGDDLIEFSEQLTESGEVIVGGAFGQ